jgi:hypothetical protein
VIQGIDVTQLPKNTCRDFLTGSCHRGDACRYTHIKLSSLTGKKRSRRKKPAQSEPMAEASGSGSENDE